jgi:predicted aspartyl protease
VSWGRRAALFAVGVLVAGGVAVVSIALSGGGSGTKPVHVEPEVTFALPTASAGCGGATTLAGGALEVPLTVSTVAGQVAESVNVCIGGQGPFPFVLDTGAGQSTIDAHLARRLHLPVAGPSTTFAGVGCTGIAEPVAVTSWSLEGITLSPQQLTAASLPQIGGKGEPVGLLGSDVLGRFGAVRIDFAAGTLVVAGAEGPPLTGSAPYTGPVGVLGPPVALTRGQGTTVPLTVAPAQGAVSLGVKVRFGGSAARDFVVDTGSSQSVVATTVARDRNLRTTNLAQRQATVCSVITVPLVHSGPWSIPGVVLHPQLVGETDFGAIGVGGLEGLLGSDQLKRFGWVVFDYPGGVMVLG